MKRIALLCLCMAVVLTELVTQSPPTARAEKQASLNGPYVDWSQQEIPFGSRSFYLAPWRSYMDTWDAGKYLNTIGVSFNVRPEEAEATAQILAEAGVRSARVEIGWGSYQFEDDTRLQEQLLQHFTLVLTALKEHGIRPLILLNANSGLPAPAKQWKVALRKKAEQGAREIYVEDASGIRPGYTGLTGMGYQSMYPIITKVDSKTGKLELSAPLSKSLSTPREVQLTQLKYRPFSGAVDEDGKPVPSAQETLNGWMTYVESTTKFVKEIMGTEDKDDAGFDIEVWNELSFGSQFLNINTYIDPDITFKEPISYTNHGITRTGAEIILPMTIDYVRDPKNRLPGVKVISGFANQRPWDNGTEMWPGQSGFSRHYYTSYDPKTSYIDTDQIEFQEKYTLDAERNIEKEHIVPEHISAFPERWFYSYQTEYVVRDLQPFPGPWTHHHRFSHPGDGQPAEVWMTETNLWRQKFAEELSQKAEVTLTDPELRKVMHHIGTKSTLRNYAFLNHKGIQTVELFAAKGGDTSFGVIPDDFYRELARNKFKLTDSARALIGPQLQAVANTVKLMETGVSIDTPRPLTVEALVEHEPRKVYEGDGTSAHPDRYHRDDFAVLPYQLEHNRFAIGYYVVTRNLTDSWDESKSLLDPARYDMPAQAFDLTISNVRGKGATLSVYDPITNEKLSAEKLDSTPTSLSVRIEAADYPRFLIVEEDGTGPLLEAPVLSHTRWGSELTFSSTTSGKARLTWGPYPNRTGGTFREITYSDEKWTKAESERNVPMIYFPRPVNDLLERKGSWGWEGTIIPEYDEEYTFIADSDSCAIELWIGREQVIERCKKPSGTITLKAGQPYPLLFHYTTPYTRTHMISLYWASASQPRQLVAPASGGKNEIIIHVKAKEPVSIQLPPLQRKDGIKIRLESEGLVNEFPRWDYDVRGAVWTAE
jgi:hypothetical protein